MYRTTEFHQPPHFDEEFHPPPYGSRRGGFGGRGMPRHFEEVPRPQARHGEPLYDDHEHVPFVANRERDQGDQTLDRIKWKLPSFKGENDPNIFLDWEEGHKGKFHPPPYGSRRGGFGGRGMPRHFEEVPRPQARHGEPLYDDHEHVPFVANRERDQVAWF
ncbi:hypothetical protein M9H77_26816 [Catharanthus roseus]|uniref:Uncharacterized protein n=1 Tax=Catharanthus roseus TaxID=4058 RepID=A0ACC0ADG4_CATRO|nr:hypothetical protein M9H77_26816 [Catharanthus roseus]